MDSGQAEAAVRALPYPNYKDFGVKRKDEWRAAQVEYRVAEKAIEAQWKSYLIETYLFDFPEIVQEEIFRRSWDDGHSSGYQSVEDCVEEYASFATLIRNAG